MTWTKRLTMTVFPIGQGLFTQSDVRVGEELFRIIYDCGELHKKLKQAETYLELLSGRQLDLIVISHFDWDHISFIPELLVKTGGAKRAWIPYLAPKLRLLFAMATAIQAELSGHSLAGYRDAVALAANPTEWLEGHGVEEVEEVGGLDQGDGEGPPPPTIPEVPLEDMEAEPPGPDKISLGPLRPWQEAFERDSNLKASCSSLDAGNRTDGLFEHVLNLITWIKPLAPDKIDDSYQRIVDLLSDETSDALRECCGPGMNEEIPEKDVADLVELICNKENKTKLMDLYKEFCGDLNSSSLFLMAQLAQLLDIPVSSETLRSKITFLLDDGSFIALPDWHNLSSPARNEIRKKWLRDIDYREWGSRFPALLWCGDAPTEILDEVMNDASDDLSKRLGATAFWQIPHHGSKYSFSRQFYDRIGTAKGFISHGHSNNFGHPSPRVVRHTGADIVTELSIPLQYSITWR